MEKLNDDFKDKGYTFNRISEIHITTIAHKTDMSYDFYVKHNMHAVGWKTNAMINKNKILINKIPRNWKHPLTKKFGSYRV